MLAAPSSPCCQDLAIGSPAVQLPVLITGHRHWTAWIMQLRCVSSGSLSSCPFAYLVGALIALLAGGLAVSGAHARAKLHEPSRVGGRGGEAAAGAECGRLRHPHGCLRASGALAAGGRLQHACHRCPVACSLLLLMPGICYHLLPGCKRGLSLKVTDPESAGKKNVGSCVLHAASSCIAFNHQESSLAGWLAAAGGTGAEQSASPRH